MGHEERNLLEDLKRRVELLEAEIEDKRATDAYLFKMITGAAESLIGLFNIQRLVGTGEATDEAMKEIKNHSREYSSNGEMAQNLIWKDESEDS